MVSLFLSLESQPHKGCLQLKSPPEDRGFIFKAVNVKAVVPHGEGKIRVRMNGGIIKLELADGF